MKKNVWINMNKNIKYLIEDIVNFNPVDYSDDEQDNINSDTIYNITKITPKTYEELRRIIFERVKENTSRVLDLSDIDTSLITEMQYLFHGIRYIQKIILGKWNTSNVINMYSMFGRCLELVELDLSSFDTSNVTDMSYMFANCCSLEKLNISNFNTSNVINMWCMFEECNSLVELDLLSFDTTNIKDMSEMFLNCSHLKSIELSNNWKINEDINTIEMFKGCWQLTDIDFSGFVYTRKSRDMFSGCLNKVIEKYKNACRKHWEEKNKDLYENNIVNFNPADYLDEDDLTNQQTITNLTYKYFPRTKIELEDIIYEHILELTTDVLDLSDINTSNITDMSYLFINIDIDVEHIKKINFDYWNTSNVKNMTSMFSGLEDIIELDLSSFNTSNVTDMTEMFNGCAALKELNLSNFNTSNVIYMSDMFINCESLTSLDLSSFDISNTLDMYQMFAGCPKLKTIKLSDKWKIREDTDIDGMFNGCRQLSNIDFSGFSIRPDDLIKKMFKECSFMLKRRYKKECIH